MGAVSKLEFKSRDEADVWSRALVRLLGPGGSVTVAVGLGGKTCPQIADDAVEAYRERMAPLLAREDALFAKHEHAGRA